MISDLFIPGFVIKRRTESTVNGNLTASYATVATISGRIRLLSGDEKITNEKENWTTTHRFYCDASNTLNRGDVIVKDGKTYDIKVIDNPHELDEFLQVDCVYDTSISFT